MKMSTIASIEYESSKAVCREAFSFNNPDKLKTKTLDEVEGIVLRTRELCIRVSQKLAIVSKRMPPELQQRLKKIEKAVDMQGIRKYCQNCIETSGVDYWLDFQQLGMYRYRAWLLYELILDLEEGTEHKTVYQELSEPQRFEALTEGS